MKRSLRLACILTTLLWGGTTAVVAAEKKQSDESPSGVAAVWDWLANADGSSNVTAVTSNTYNGYKRTLLPDGSYRPESYVFGEGGYGSGNIAGEASESVEFLKIAKTIAGPLVAQNYHSNRSVENTELLIVIYWGVTFSDNSLANGFTPDMSSVVSAPPPVTGPPGAPPAAGNPLNPTGAQFDSGFDAMNAFQNWQRDQTIEQTARLLGYYPELTKTAGAHFLRDRHMDLVTELEDPRYYVVLLAFDFQKLTKEKRKVLLWETRYSIRERRNDFERDLAAMTRRASKFFGKNSNGLQRDVPFRGGTVELGDLKVVEFQPGEVKRIPSPNAEKPKTSTEPPER